MKELVTEIQINAKADAVWSILIDFASYSAWNPFIKKASGNAVVADQLEIFIQLEADKGMTFKPVVKTIVDDENYKELSWLGRLFIPGLFDGEHIFTITNNDQGCLLVQKENFSGLLIPLVWDGIKDNTRNGFESMNLTLKKRAESL